MISQSHRTADLAYPASWAHSAFRSAAAVLGFAVVYFALYAHTRTISHLLLGETMLVLSALPSLFWARRGRPHLPIFETFLLTFVNAYALPLLNGHTALAVYTDDQLTTATVAVITFQVAALLAHEAARGRALTSPFWREEIVSKSVSPWLNYGMALNTLYLFASTFMSVIPPAAGSVLRAIFFGIGIICTFITSRRFARQELSPSERVFFISNLVLQCVIMITSLFLVGALSQLLLALVGYTSTRGRLPWIACIVGLVCFAILHNGKAAMREKYWGKDESRIPEVSQLPRYFAEWIQQGLRFGHEDEDDQRITRKLIERTSLFHIMCLVTSLSPEPLPYLEGETYKDIPGQLVPRLFWPSKPPAHVSTSKLSVYYGLQSEEDTQKTTIGFGVVSEAYANFGFWGLALVGAAIGFVTKKIRCWSSETPLLSYGGLLMVIFLAWSFQIEFTASIWLSSFYQASIAVLAVPFMLRKALGQ
ncbi:MAG: hypothetical protein QM790_08410 [Nibricoccus sp.]